MQTPTPLQMAAGVFRACRLAGDLQDVVTSVFDCSLYLIHVRTGP